MSYTYKYPQPAVTADVVAFTSTSLMTGATLPTLAFDHDEIMADAITSYNKLKNK